MTHSSVTMEFEANAIIVLIVEAPAVPPRPLEQRRTRTEASGGPAHTPTVAYSAGLGLPGAECAICLAKFEGGVGIRVLERCRCGFHVECIQRWPGSHLSCPNCRSSCFASGGLFFIFIFV